MLHSQSEFEILIIEFLNDNKVYELPLQVLLDDIQYHPNLQSEHIIPVYPSSELQLHCPLKSLQSEASPTVPIRLQKQSANKLIVQGAVEN